jgi:hypothetical protein
MKALLLITYSLLVVPIGELTLPRDRETILPEIGFVHQLNLADTATIKSVKYLHDDMVIDRYTLADFKEFIAKKETGSSPDVVRYAKVNSYGYLGKYQFHIRTVNSLAKGGYLRYRHVTKEKFLEDYDLQEETMNALIVHHLEIFRAWGLDEYVGVEVNDFTITFEGLLAGAHLVGIVALRHYLQNDFSLQPFNYRGRKTYKVDANGTTVEDYIKIFNL